MPNTKVLEHVLLDDFVHAHIAETSLGGAHGYQRDHLLTAAGNEVIDLVKPLGENGGNHHPAHGADRGDPHRVGKGHGRHMLEVRSGKLRAKGRGGQLKLNGADKRIPQPAEGRAQSHDQSQRSHGPRRGQWR